MKNTITQDLDSHGKIIYKIPVGNLSRKETEKIISELLEKYRSDDDIWLTEYNRKELIKNRKLKIQKIENEKY